jgi:chromosome segregation ATPase
MMDEDQIASMLAENEALKSQQAELSTSNQSMKQKMEELLGETKKAKAEREAADQTAKQAAEAKAKAAGDFEQLHRSSEEARQTLEQQLKGLRDGIAGEKRNSAAMRIAGELADGPNAEILSEFISRRLKYTDDGLKVTNEAGELTVSTVDQLAEEFKGNARFAALLKGNQSSGGGASGGGKQGGGAAKEMSRSEFDSMPPNKRTEFIRAGGRPHD